MSSAGVEAVELAASAGLILDDWQSWWVDEALSERADGDWAARENVLITARQNGKNRVLAALELFYLFLMGDELVIHSAHELPTAKAHFNFLVRLIDRTPDLARKCNRPTYVNGQEAINLKSGATLQIRARGKNSGRGLTAARLVFDEAFKIPTEAMGALVPTLRAMRNPQITYASSAPKADSVVLHSLIQRGRQGTDLTDRLFYADWGNPQGTAMDDVDAWYRSNPALGIWIPEESLHDEYRTLVAGGNEELIAEFAREAVGIGQDPPTVDGRPVKLPADKWAATVRRSVPNPAPGKVTIGFDADRDGTSVSLVIGYGSLEEPVVEQIEHRTDSGWLPAELVRLVKKWKPVAVGCNGAGPATALVGPVLKAFADAGIKPDLLTQLGTKEYVAACGGFYNDVIEGRLMRPAVEQGPLDRAAGDASERQVGDAWAWDRRQATVPISPLVAATVARALLPVKTAPGLWVARR